MPLVEVRSLAVPVTLFPPACCSNVHTRKWHRTSSNGNSCTNFNCIFWRHIVLCKHCCMFRPLTAVCFHVFFSHHMHRTCDSSWKDTVFTCRCVLTPKHAPHIHEVRCVCVCDAERTWNSSKGKGQVHPFTCHEGPEEE